VLEKVVLRTLSKAVYSPENEGHFGLGLDFYSHFTSPIRRYPDLQIHRIIKEKINNKLDNLRIKHYKDILENIANTCSTQERKAEKLEYKVRDYYTCKFYEAKV
jgi:ribonuclease R